jgi:CRISP-associated protein Cas1
MENTLYLESYGLSLRKDGETFKITEKGKKARQIPAIHVGAVMVSNEAVSISGGVVRLCNDHDIPIFFLPRNGEEPSVLCRVECRRPELQAAQVLAGADPARLLVLARGFAGGKIRNQLSLAGYFRNSRPGGDPAACDALAETAREALDFLKREEPGEISRMRGRLLSAEGRVASKYWAAGAERIPAALAFPGRRRKGAADVVNAMLNYGYAILAGRVRAAILKAGFSSYFSFLHTPRQGRASLVYDLMEEFRPWAVDRVVFGAVSRGGEAKIDAEGRLPAEVRRMLIERLEKRWESDDLRGLLKKQGEAVAAVLEGGGVYDPTVFWPNGRSRAARRVSG